MNSHCVWSEKNSDHHGILSRYCMDKDNNIWVFLPLVYVSSTQYISYTHTHHLWLIK